MKRLPYILLLLIPLGLYSVKTYLQGSTTSLEPLPITFMATPLTYKIEPILMKKRDKYPSYVPITEAIRPITKEHFHCKGTHNNAIVSHNIDGKKKFFQFCDGIYTHSLPLIEGNQTVLPHLIELLNYAQNKIQTTIHILSGHRCYIHQQYLSSNQKELTSLHQLGAAADICFDQAPSYELPTLVEAILSWYETSSLPGARFSTNNEKTRWSNRYITLTYHTTTQLPSTHYKGPHITVEVKVDPETRKPITYSYRKVRSNIIMY